MFLSASVVLIPAIAIAVSSSVVCALGTVFIGASFTDVTVISRVLVTLLVPSKTV